MELSFKCFFRLGIVMLLMFVALKNFRGFPQEAEAVIRAAGMRGHSSSGSYNSLYPGRYVYSSFGRSSYSRRKNSAPLDPATRNRMYYEKKMAEWREKNKHLLENSDEEFHEQDDTQNPSDESEYDYEYGNDSSGELTNTEGTPETTTVVTEEILITSQANNDTTTTVNITATPEAPVVNVTEPTTLGSIFTTSTSTDSVPEITERSTRAARRAYGLRYGRVKVERL